MNIEARDRVAKHVERILRSGEQVRSPAVAEALGLRPNTVTSHLVALGYRSEGTGRGRHWLPPQGES